MAQATATAIGLMSGTSMDGIDVAMVETDGVDHVSFAGNLFVPYEAQFRRRLGVALEMAKSMTSREQRPGDLPDLEREITLRHAAATDQFLSENGMDRRSIDLIGFHGHTVLHRPEQAMTAQLGDGGLLAQRTGIPVVYDLRANDMAHGGQGAPLVPIYHAALARSLRGDLAKNLPICFVNIGGISNITFLPESGDPIAFDTGPGNALIDQWVSREGGVPYDAGGAIANEGGIAEVVVSRYLDTPFFERPGPKSLDRNDFTLEEVAGLELSDGARTLAAVSARAILASVRHLPKQPKLWIVCGGGRKNPHIVNDLRAGATLTGGVVAVAEEAGLNGDFIEAEAWAYLAVRSARGLPITYPTTTGCREPVSGGVLVRPD